VVMMFYEPNITLLASAGLNFYYHRARTPDPAHVKPVSAQDADGK